MSLNFFLSLLFSIAYPIPLYPPNLPIVAVIVVIFPQNDRLQVEAFPRDGHPLHPRFVYAHPPSRIGLLFLDFFYSCIRIEYHY